jgi:NAD(P)-dependent dehydrogenase (short-subunit alcohol dehydrogenase family)
MTIHPAIQPGGIAVITGAASGIGRAAARRLAARGMRCVLVDRDEAGLATLAQELGDAASAMPVNVADAAAMKDLAEQVMKQWGPVSVLMNNAGIGGGGDAISNPDGWARVLGVNLMGVVHGVQNFVPAMVASDRPGLVINTGSKQGITQPPGDTAYNVSKSGVKALTEGLAHTLREQTAGRVTAHLLIPGFTYTGMIARHIPNQPPAAWTAEQVVDRMMEGVERQEFYILCQDNETTRAQDERRILWSALDLVENRPALSRWHPDHADEAAAFIRGDSEISSNKK